MGTPDFAVPSLRALVENNFKVVAVVTAADKPKGRGQKLVPSPVKRAAQEFNIPVLQPKNLKSQEFQQRLQDYNPNLQVVVAFRMLPEVVWQYPEYGTFNLHASLLPQYRGAAPINWAIINGEKTTGLTTFFLQHEIDTGNIIAQEKIVISESDNAGSLHDKMMQQGAALVLETVQKIADNDFELTPQSAQVDSKEAPKLNKESTAIDWNQPVAKVHNFIRGLSPYPSAWTQINGSYYKILASAPNYDHSNLQPGEYLSDDKSFLQIKCGDGMLCILELQKEGKRRMDIQSFLRGNEL